MDQQQRNQQGKIQGQKMRDEILYRMNELKEEEYKNFSATLIPGIDRDKMLGVRIPALRKIASALLKGDQTDLSQYLEILSNENPVECLYEEKLLWGILLAKVKMTDEERMDEFVDHNCAGSCDCTFCKKYIKARKVKDNGL